METLLFVDAAYDWACALLARARNAIYESKVDEKKTLPLFQLPREVRLQIYEHMLVNDPPTIGRHQYMYHTFIHDKIAVIYKDMLASVFFYSAPLIVNPDYEPDGALYIWPFRYVDYRYPDSQGHRIRLQLAPEEIRDKCTHLHCVLRWFRCHSSWEPPERTLRRCRYTRDRMGVPPENVSVMPTREPFIDHDRLEVIRARLAHNLSEELALVRRFLFQDLRRFVTRHLQPLNDFFLSGRWMVPLDWYYHYAMGRKSEHGYMGIAEASLQVSTLAMVALVTCACLVANLLYCWNPIVYDELRENVGVVSVTVIIVLVVVWMRPLGM